MALRLSSLLPRKKRPVSLPEEQCGSCMTDRRLKNGASEELTPSENPARICRNGVFLQGRPFLPY